MGEFLQPWHLIVFSFLGLPPISVLWALPLWFVCKRVGFSPWLTLLNFIPLGTTVLLFVLAFGNQKPTGVQDRPIASQTIA
jgi:hypothetical protein